MVEIRERGVLGVEEVVGLLRRQIEAEAKGETRQVEGEENEKSRLERQRSAMGLSVSGLLRGSGARRGGGRGLWDVGGGHVRWQSEGSTGHVV